MPAIQPTRVRQQAALLAENFEDPPAFLRALHDYLDFYADRAHRPGQSGKPGPLTKAYKVRPPVLRQVLQELISRASEKPDQALALCDALWQEPYLETRLLATMLLGQIPPDSPEPITQRVNAWAQPDLESALLKALLTNGFSRLRQANSQAIMKLIQGWIYSEDKFHRQLALHALRPLIEDQNFENLPAFYQLIQPMTRKTPSGLRADLLDILTALVHRSPYETAYFLRQTMESPNAVDTPWYIRQTLREFPAELQDSLRQAARRGAPITLARSKQGE